MSYKSGYIGRNPGDGNSAIVRQTYSLTSETTELSFTAGYIVGFVDVYNNGVKLIDVQDYEATNASTITLTSAAPSGDVIEVVAYKALNIGSVSNANGNFTVSGNTTLSGTVSVASTATLSGVTTCEGDLYVGGDLYGDGSNLTGIANTAYIDAINITSSGIVSVTNTTASTSSATGALIVSGGVGIAGSLHVGENVSIGGTLTYEDVTNIDSVGIVTARLGVIATAGRGVEITAGGLNVAAGIATLTGYVSTGSTVGAAGSIYFPDSKGVNFGNASEGDFQIFHDSTTNVINSVSANLEIRHGTEKLAAFAQDGQAELYYNNSKKFESTNDGTVTTGIATATSIDAAIGIWTLGADGTSHYTFTGIGLTVTTNDPDLNLVRGQRYIFKNRSGGHPFRIQSTANGSAGTQYNHGVTNNDGGDGTDITFEVPYSAPDLLYYQCTSHGSMGGVIYIGNSWSGLTVGSGATIFSPATNVITAGTASTEVVRINAAAGVLLNNGILVERVKIDSDSINSDKFIRLQDGMVHYRSSAVGAASVKPDIVSNTGINTDLAIGDTISVTLMTVAGNTSHFVSSVAIDGKHTGITTHWVGGSIPTAGGGSGVDTYSFNILKTASETYTVIANQVKTS